MPSSVPVIDLTPWFGGDEAARAAVAAEVDAAPDFGTVTILDREPGRGGLPVWTEEDGWEDAPHVPGAVIESLQPPIGRPNDYAPVVSAQFLRKLLDAITVG